MTAQQSSSATAAMEVRMVLRPRCCSWGFFSRLQLQVSSWSGAVCAQYYHRHQRCSKRCCSSSTSPPSARAAASASPPPPPQQQQPTQGGAAMATNKPVCCSRRKREREREGQTTVTCHCIAVVLTFFQLKYSVEIQNMFLGGAESCENSIEGAL